MAETASAIAMASTSNSTATASASHYQPSSSIDKSSDEERRDDEEEEDGEGGGGTSRKDRPAPLDVTILHYQLLNFLCDYLLRFSFFLKKTRLEDLNDQLPVDPLPQRLFDQCTAQAPEMKKKERLDTDEWMRKVKSRIKKLEMQTM
ncbi:hypothetical protein CHUAL_010387 [Chamberlinius hualienensis]